MRGERNGDGSRAGADVRDAERVFVVEAGGPQEHGFHEVLGFGARDEDGGCDPEVETVELLVAEDVLQRLVRGAAGDEVFEGGLLGGGEFGFRVRGKVDAVALEDVGEQEFRVAFVDVCGGLGGGFVERHVCWQG